MKKGSFRDCLWYCSWRWTSAQFMTGSLILILTLRKELRWYGLYDHHLCNLSIRASVSSLEGTVMCMSFCVQNEWILKDAQCNRFDNIMHACGSVKLLDYCWIVTEQCWTHTQTWEQRVAKQPSLYNGTKFRVNNSLIKLKLFAAIVTFWTCLSWRFATWQMFW